MFYKVLSCILAIALIAVIIYLIVSQVKEHLSTQDPVLHDLKNTLRDALEKTKNICLSKSNCMLKDRIREKGGIQKCLDDVSLHSGSKSFTINKKKIYLCLKDENGKYYDKNMLIYVFTHELAHVLSESIGHTEEFHQIFEELLKCLAEQKKYDPNKPLVQNYCEYSI